MLRPISGVVTQQYYQPHPQSTFKDIVLAPHDFAGAGNITLIWLVNCKMKLIYAMSWIFYNGWSER